MPDAMSTGWVSQANMRCATVATGAFVDFGVVGTLVPFLGYPIVLVDTTGKRATGYIRAQGGGETLGADLTPNSTALADGQTEANASTGYGSQGTPTSFASDATTPHAGTWNFKVVTQATAGQGFIQNTGNTVTIGWLVKHVFWQRSDGTNAIRASIRSNSTATVLNTAANQSSATYAAVTLYTTAIETATKLTVQCVSNAVTTFYVDTYSAQRVTAVSATGVTIFNAASGGAQSWASIDANFNPNDSVLGYTIGFPEDGRSMSVLGVGR